MASFGRLARARIDELRGAGTRKALSLEEVAKQARLSKRALEKWKSGETETPSEDSVVAALRCFVDEATAREEVRCLKEATRPTGLPASDPVPKPFNDAPASKRQPRLTAPPEVQRISHYTRRAMRVVGRDVEWDRLQSFVEADKPFAWLQLAGVAGQGKSRLALELMLALREKNWLVGFLNDGDVAEFDEEWREWQPSRPTLLIVDYVIGRDRSVGLILRQLARRNEELRLPVRLLLLERQRWDHGEALSAGSTERLGLSGRAEWFVALTERHDGADAALSQTRFAEGVIELTKLGLPDLVSIVRRIAATESAAVVLDDSRMEAELTRIDADGRPLYAYFLGETLARNPTRYGWTLEDLLDGVLHKDCAQRWRAAFADAPPEIGEDDPAARLAVIATMCGGVDCTHARTLGAPFDAGPKIRRRALVMTDGPATAGVPANVISPLQPDILGEWFVLRSIRDGLPLKVLCDAAWRTSPHGMARFLERLVQDFPAHGITADLLKQPPPGEGAADAYALVSASIVFLLAKARIDIPANLIEMLKRSAAGGAGRAMFNLGFCYAQGTGVGKDMGAAVEWYRKGVAAGSDAAMAILGSCYEEGNGVGKDLGVAVEWYRKGAAMRDAGAMVRLGRCYLSGTGVEKDLSAAVEWFSKGAALGNGYAMANLGQCYVQGDGVEKDPIAAVEWYRKGVAAGNDGAMAALGLCYELGIGVEKDLGAAVGWYRKGAAMRDAGAMVCLGRSYLSGTGVEKDLSAAVEWFRKGVAAGDGSAMVELGVCYEEGTGIEKDLGAAVEWYRKGAAAGDGHAMVNLGKCYEDGIGVEENPIAAVELYRRGVAAGNVDAMVNLGECYEDGIGVEEDPIAAVELYRKGGAAGHGRAMFDLGLCYERGIGVAKDLDAAVEWYRKGEAIGSSLAKLRLLCGDGSVRRLKPGEEEDGS